MDLIPENFAHSGNKKKHPFKSIHARECMRACEMESISLREFPTLVATKNSAAVMSEGASILGGSDQFLNRYILILRAKCSKWCYCIAL